MRIIKMVNLLLMRKAKNIKPKKAKPYSIPSFPILLTDQAPVTYNGKIIDFKILIIENKTV